MSALIVPSLLNRSLASKWISIGLAFKQDTQLPSCANNANESVCLLATVIKPAGTEVSAPHMTHLFDHFWISWELGAESGTAKVANTELQNGSSETFRKALQKHANIW